MNSLDRPELEPGRPWQWAFDLLVAVAAAVTWILFTYDVLVPRQVALILLLLFAVACAAYLVSVLREDEARPGSTLSLAVLAALFLVHEYALSGGAPQWLQIAVLLFVFMFMVGGDHEVSSSRPRPADRTPPPY